MENKYKNQIIIDGLQYCNWNRELFEDLLKGGLTAVHVTLVYWENTQESFQKIEEWKKHIQDNKDIICHAKNANDILTAKKNNISGWARNLDDGRVEVLLEGDDEAVNAVVKWSHIGPANARVDEVKIKTEEFKNEFLSFEVLY